MTYEELKAQDDWYRSFPDWGDYDVIILDNIRARLLFMIAQSLTCVPWVLE